MKKPILVTLGILGLLFVTFLGLSVIHHKGTSEKAVANDETSNILDNKIFNLLNFKNRGPKSDRPKDVQQGFVYYDTSLKRPIFWNGKEWDEKTVINMKEFGAKGDGETDNTETIQKALNLARDYGKVRLYFPAGDYHTKNLRLYKNTSVTLNNNAVIKRIGKGYKLFVNGKIGDSNYAYRYNGEGNIHFKGGTIDLNTIEAPIPDDKSTTAFDLAHAENLTFEDLKIKNGQNGHYFQLSSSRRVRIINCWFGDVNYTNPSSENYELIQIEEATKISFPTFGGYDGTVSRDILIKGCHFENVIRAIGTHSYSRKKDGVTPLRYVENIRIINNVFNHSISQFGHFAAFKNLVIENNVFENYGEDPIYLYKTINPLIKDNQFIGGTN